MNRRTIKATSSIVLLTILLFTYQVYAIPSSPSFNQSTPSKGIAKQDVAENETATDSTEITDPAVQRLYDLAEKARDQNRLCEATNYVEKAFCIAPTNTDLLSLRAEIAELLMAYGIAEESYRRILCLKPGNLDALIGLADILSSERKFVESKKIYTVLTHTHPQNKEVWLGYADMEDNRNEYRNVFPILEHYRCLFGSTFDYWSRKARYLVDAGRYHSSILMNDCLLAKKPDDPYLLSTRVLDLDQANCKCAAVEELGYLKTRFPNNSENFDLARTVYTPIRSNFSITPSYYTSTTPVDVALLPINLQIFLNPRTSLLFRALYERLQTSPDTDFTTTDGGTSIEDYSLFAGFTRSGCFWNSEVLIGYLDIQNGKKSAIAHLYGIYYVNEAFKVELRALYDLYRPYEYSNSPRSVSLGIMETAARATFLWEPIIETHLDLTVNQSHLSDGNNYSEATFTPYTRLFTYDQMNLDVGLNIDWMSFNKDVTDTNGYFSPTHYLLYQGTTSIYISPSDNTSYEIYAGLGKEQDGTSPGSRTQFNASFLATYGIYCDWQLSLLAEYESQMGPDSFHESYFKIQLLRRF